MDATPTRLIMTTDMLERLVSIDTGWNSNPASIGFVPRRSGCGLSRKQRSCRSKGKFARRDRPSRSWRMGTRRASRFATVVKQITSSDSTSPVSYGAGGGSCQTAGIPAIIRGPGHFARAHNSDEGVAGSELEARDYFLRRLAKRLLA
jgi:hypothetical protein